MNTQGVKRPTWKMHVRPIGASHELWDEMKVEARSAIQAEAILRRRGYETVIQTAMRVDEVPDPPKPAQLKPIVCASCGYSLAGLVIQEASVICPECSHSQPLIAWSSDQAEQIAKNHPVVGMFAAFSMAVVVLVLFLIIILFISVWT